jgi:hypothetical protein
MLLLQKTNLSKEILTLAAVTLLGGVIGLNTLSCTGAKDDAAILSPSASVVPEHIYPYQGFGSSLAASGDHVVVAGGARQSDEGSSPTEAVYIYTRKDGRSVQRTFIKSGLRTKDSWRVAANGPYAAAVTYSNSPTVYVLELDSARAKTSFGPKESNSDLLFGAAIAIKGDSVVVTGQGRNGKPGIAYVFSLKSGGQVAALHAAESSPNDGFGHAVAISNTLVAVSAPWADLADQKDAGAVYVFERSTGKQMRRIAASTPKGRELFGFSIAIHGDVLAIGAPKAPEVEEGGTVYLYEVSSGRYLGHVSSRSERGDRFGTAVALSRRLLGVGAPKGRSEDGAVTGAAYVFGASTRKLIARLVGSNMEAGDAFGSSVVIEDGRVVVGSPLGQTEAEQDCGIVYIYRVIDRPEVIGSQEVDPPTTRPGT